MSIAASMNEMKAQTQTPEQKRDCLFYIKHGLKWLGVSILVLLTLGFAYQTIGTELDKQNYPARGQFFEAKAQITVRLWVMNSIRGRSLMPS